MKKTIISLAVAAGMAASSAAFAAPTVYGNLHLSIDDEDNGLATDDLDMKSQTSAIGLKGSEDLGDGMKAFYKVEFQLDLSERNQAKDGSGTSALTDRDQYIGLKGGMGTVKFGTMSSNYKQMGGKVDPMYRTSLEGRGSLAMQSNELHAGAGRTRGRMTDAVQYSSPKMGGMQLIINTTFDGADVGNADIDETMGVGFRYAAKSFSVYADYISTASTATDDESATKIGGTFKAGPVKLGVQLEQSEDLTGNDYMMVSANYAIDKNNAIYFSFGTMDDDVAAGVTTADTGSSSFALMYNHNMSKKTNLYVGYGDRDDDASTSNDFSVITAGMRVKF